jgi:hypothetical protein
VIPYATNFTLESFSQPGHTSGYGIGGYWQPVQSGWLPSISAGWGINSTTYSQDVNLGGLVRTSQSWSVGLQWQDDLCKGNVLGTAVAQPTFATSLYGGGRYLAAFSRIFVPSSWESLIRASGTLTSCLIGASLSISKLAKFRASIVRR